MTMKNSNKKGKDAQVKAEGEFSTGMTSINVNIRILRWMSFIDDWLQSRA